MALTDKPVGYLGSGEEIIYDVIQVPVDKHISKPVKPEEIEIMVVDLENDFHSTEPFAFKNGDDVYVAIKDNKMIKHGSEIKFNFHYADGDVETCVESCDSVISVCAKSEYFSIFHIHDLCPEPCMPEGPMIVGIRFDGVLHAKSGVVFYSDESGCIVHSAGPRSNKYEVLFPGTYSTCPAKVIEGGETRDLCCDTVIKVMRDDMPKDIDRPRSLFGLKKISSRQERKDFMKAIHDSISKIFDSKEGYFCHTVSEEPVTKKQKISTRGSITFLLSPVSKRPKNSTRAQ